MPRILAIETTDIRFPTSTRLDGSDAMNPDPDYSAAYLEILTDAAPALSGHAFVFTIGRGNDVQVAALEALKGHLVGRELESVVSDMGSTYRELVGDSQLRWLGPEKGVMHMAIGGAVNALWDIKAKQAGLPLWQLLGRMTPEEIVDLVDFRYLSNALTPEEALAILREAVPGRPHREAQLLAIGYPAYTTSPGWLGYSDEKLARLCRQAIADGFQQIKLKVGANLADDIRRLSVARDVCGPNFPIAIDANQRWEVSEAISWVKALAQFHPTWVEEPTSPDDVLGHQQIARAISPIRVASGEHAHNRVIFKQLLQAGAIDVMQIDAVRVAGVNENIANLLLAAKYEVPVCPHAGGVGLCEAVQHLSMFDYVAVSGTTENRAIEYVDHLHEHFLAPTEIRQGNYIAPRAPGAGFEMKPESRARFTWNPDDVVA
ncbi:enolase C-terminal domain-like protein [Microbacterium sp. NPDC057407]|uniref:enolase C-terminal domain-like protein n=1 Tax=Microbacterium sp. NPDC057407 TaxID=3346120 RepID=UPI00366B5A36